MTFIDFFAGIGGFRRGLELAGAHCVGFCEYDRFAVASYTSMHLITGGQREYLGRLDFRKRRKEILKDEYRNGEWHASDIRQVRAGDVPRADCWCFGAPCQSFSIAGSRTGLSGESGLVREIFRILRETGEADRPEWLIYENVKGMLSSSGGFDYLAILLEMDELGYDVEWQLLNSKDWVPQNRERVYTVGHLRRRGSRKIFPFEGEDGADCFSVNPGKACCPIVVINTRGRVNEPVRQGSIVPTLRSEMHGNAPEICIPVVTPNRTNKGKNERRLRENSEPSYTITSQDRHGVAVPVGIDIVCNTKPPHCTRIGQRDDVWGARGIAGSLGATDYKLPHRVAIPMDEDDKGIDVIWYEKYQCYIAIRKLTPRECFRLQGWQRGCGDDRYFERAQFVNSDSQLYKQAGNGVTVNVVEAIGKEMGKFEASRLG